MPSALVLYLDFDFFGCTMVDFYYKLCLIALLIRFIDNPVILLGKKNIYL